MTQLTKADAARQLGISRTILYTCIDQGQLSATPEGLSDQTELVRIAPPLDVHRERPRPPMDMATMDASTSHSAHHRRPVDMPRGHNTDGRFWYHLPTSHTRALLWLKDAKPRSRFASRRRNARRSWRGSGRPLSGPGWLDGPGLSYSWLTG